MTVNLNKIKVLRTVGVQYVLATLKKDENDLKNNKFQISLQYLTVFWVWRNKTRDVNLTMSYEVMNVI